MAATKTNFIPTNASLFKWATASRAWRASKQASRRLLPSLFSTPAQNAPCDDGVNKTSGVRRGERGSNYSQRRERGGEWGGEKVPKQESSISGIRRLSSLSPPVDFDFFSHSSLSHFLA